MDIPVGAGLTTAARTQPKRRLWIVTGASGFLGNTIVHELIRRAERVRAVVSPRSKTVSQREIGVEPAGCDLVTADVTKLDEVVAAFTHEPDEEVFVAHCAGAIAITMKVPNEVWAVNVTGTENVINACRITNCARLLYVSTVHTIEEPAHGVVTREHDDPATYSPERIVGGYAQSKTAATRLVLEADDLWRVVVLPSGMAGPEPDGERNNLNRLIRDAASGRLAAAVEGAYDIVDVRDVATGVISALSRGKSGQTYILSGSYESIPTLIASVGGLLENSTSRRRVRTIPFWLARAVAPLAEFFAKLTSRPPRFTSYSLYTVRSSANFSNDRARHELHFNPRPLAETVQDVLAYHNLATQSESRP